MSTRKVTALIASLALAASVPTAALANEGGVPHSTKACKTKNKGHGPKRLAPNSHGKKCGFHH